MHEFISAVLLDVIDTHGEGTVLTLLQGLLKSHVVRTESVKHGMFVKLHYSKAQRVSSSCKQNVQLFGRLVAPPPAFPPPQPPTTGNYMDGRSNDYLTYQSHCFSDNVLNSRAHSFATCQFKTNMNIRNASAYQTPDLTAVGSAARQEKLDRPLAVPILQTEVDSLSSGTTAFSGIRTKQSVSDPVMEHDPWWGKSVSVVDQSHPVYTGVQDWASYHPTSAGRIVDSANEAITSASTSNQKQLPSSLLDRRRSRENCEDSYDEVTSDTASHNRDDGIVSISQAIVRSVISRCLVRVRHRRQVQWIALMSKYLQKIKTDKQNAVGFELILAQLEGTMSYDITSRLLQLSLNHTSSHCIDDEKKKKYILQYTNV